MPEVQISVMVCSSKYQIFGELLKHNYYIALNHEELTAKE
jgi:hypothetical protein